MIFLIAFTCEWFAEIKGSVIISQFETINERPSTSIMSTEWGKKRLQRKRERELCRYSDKGKKGKETERQTDSESKRDNEEYEKLDCLCQILYSSIKLFFKLKFDDL